MIIVTKKGVTQDQLDHIRERIESLGLRTHMSRGESRTVIGCLGDESLLEHVPLLSIAGVEAVHQGAQALQARVQGVLAGAHRGNARRHRDRWKRARGHRRTVFRGTR